jgi:D-alanyl-D-alanine carboxypeptidase/D-alanyl-D-alanine-endopeptidase (penicillin-binding protein 4)
VKRAAFLLVLLAACPVFARRHHHARPRAERVASGPMDLATALAEAARKPPTGPQGVSVAIASEDRQAPLLFEVGSDHSLSIASVTKMFSTAAALHYLGKDYQFRTTFYRQGQIQNGILSGSLLVVGGGDPNISGRFYDNDIHSIFDTWAAGLTQLGITRVAGELLLNSTSFDDQYRNPGWPSGQESRWYEAPVSALSYNENVVSVVIDPGARPGAPAVVHFDPPTGFLQTVSSARTVSRRGAARLAVGRPFGSPVVTVAGTVPFHRYGWSTFIAIDDPPLFFGSALKERLEHSGIFLGGGIRSTAVKPDGSWIKVATTTSDLLASIAVANKRSHSFYAEQIFKTMAAEKGAGGTWPEALRLEREYLRGLGLDPARYDLHDGCGLNPENRVAARDLVEFLRAVAVSPIGETWIPTLAISGEKESTLRHRDRAGDERGRVYAKTGTLERVSALAGFVTAKSGRRYVFAIVLNGQSAGAAHPYQDRIVRAILENG